MSVMGDIRFDGGLRIWKHWKNRDNGLVHSIDWSLEDLLKLAAPLQIDLARVVGVPFTPGQGFLFDTSSGFQLSARHYGSGLMFEFCKDPETATGQWAGL